MPAIISALISHAQSLGVFASVNAHEPKAAPTNGLTGALWVDEITPAPRRSGLASTSFRLAFNFRVSMNMLADPQDEIDPAVLTAVMLLLRAYAGDFELGGQVAFIDLLGAHGAPLSAKAGYMPQDGRLYRVMTIAIPVVINDVTDQAP